MPERISILIGAVLGVALSILAGNSIVKYLYPPDKETTLIVKVIDMSLAKPEFYLTTTELFVLAALSAVVIIGLAIYIRRTRPKVF